MNNVSKKSEEVLENAQATDDEIGKLIAENNLEDLTAQEKLWSMVAYASFFCILPLVLFRQSSFAQFHGRQGMVLTIFSLPAGFIFSLLGRWGTGLFSLAYFALCVAAGYKALQGEKWEIPGIKKIADKFALPYKKESESD